MLNQYKSLAKLREVRKRGEEDEDDDGICEDCKDQAGGVGLLNRPPSFEINIFFDVFRNEADGRFTLVPTIQIKHF